MPDEAKSKVKRTDHLIDDQPITPMPKRCVKWECQDAKPLRRVNGFMVCPKCGASYGR